MDKHGHDTDTPEYRWNRAVREIRSHGIVFRRNVMKCCNGCIVHEDLGLDPQKDKDVPWAYTFGGQGQAWKWLAGVPVLRRAQSHLESGRRLKHMHIKYGGPDTVAVGTIIADAFREAGLTVEWDGSEYSAIEVQFPEMPLDGYLS